MTTPLDKAVEVMAEKLIELNDVYAKARAKEQLQAADDLLREHYWGELRERLLGEEAVEEAGRALFNEPAELDGCRCGDCLREMSRSAIRAALATTQKEEL